MSESVEVEPIYAEYADAECVDEVVEKKVEEAIGKLRPRLVADVKKSINNPSAAKVEEKRGDEAKKKASLTDEQALQSLGGEAAIEK